MPRFCDSCGAALLEGKRFCSECGAPIPQASETERAAQETAPILEDWETPYVPPKIEKTCARCGSVLPEDALYCEQCSQSVHPQSAPQTWLRFETIREIERKYSSLWLILIVFLAVVLFGLPESMLATGAPALFKSAAAWTAAFVVLCALVWLDFYLERRAALKKLGVDPGRADLFGDKRLRAVARSRSMEFRFSAIFATFALIALYCLSLVRFAD